MFKPQHHQVTTVGPFTQGRQNTLRKRVEVKEALYHPFTGTAVQHSTGELQGIDSIHSQTTNPNHPAVSASLPIELKAFHARFELNNKDPLLQAPAASPEIMPVVSVNSVRTNVQQNQHTESHQARWNFRTCRGQ